MANEHHTRDAAIWGGALGAGAGAVLAGWPGAVIGLVVVAPATAIAKPGALWGRILHSALLMALIGALLGLVLGPLPTAIVCGAIVGALGVRPAKLALGIATGVVIGLLVDQPALAGALTALVYRLIAAYAYRKRPLVRIMAEAVPAEELLYVVPFEARTKYVGADYVEQLADLQGGTFARNPPDVGILATLDSLNGPTFQADRVHPLIREFYEHTSRFKLSIVPEWRTWMKPAYTLFKATVAEPLGQATIPSNIEEAQRGMISTIDTVSFDGDNIDIRGWVRTYADSGKPIYVGIYTSFRHAGRGYVSVGFPIPSSNFTATLQPHNVDSDGLLLTSKSDLPFPGHYLSAVEDGKLTVLKLLAFQERIHVHVDDGELKTEHSFSLAGQRFLTLHYVIERL
ncbi:hypothetical protein [Solirubrobacter soli]|uniref:hypothetical protein n=1 Tax=Solirubrobacter soli TaxID=363832 RepID=UPI00041AA98E|nr:hypothetical protein [Solirubrobacter soli]